MVDGDNNRSKRKEEKSGRNQPSLNEWERSPSANPQTENSITKQLKDFQTQALEIGQAFTGAEIGQAFTGAEIGQAFKGAEIGQAFKGAEIGQAFKGAEIGMVFKLIKGTEIGKAFKGAEIGQSFNGAASEVCCLNAISAVSEVCCLFSPLKEQHQKCAICSIL